MIADDHELNATLERIRQSQEVEQEGDHRAGIFSGPKLTDQPLARRKEFWRRARARLALATCSPGLIQRHALEWCSLVHHGVI
jgi:hypothetical protein